MLRLIGILVGSALAVGLLIIALGVPEFSQPEIEPVQTVSVPLPDAAPPQPPVAADEPAEEPHVEAVAEPEPPGPALTDAETEALIEQIFAPEPAPGIALPEETTPPVAVEDHWYAFWSPFRSELAANGFVSKLQQTTGMDYRVVKVKTGVYEVAFAYTDDSDVQEKLARISAATGLDMSGG
jgi:hypothetical protein